MSKKKNPRPIPTKEDSQRMAKAWFEQASQDLQAAEWLLKGGFFEHTAFYSEQVAEKSLKGFLFFNGYSRFRRHNLTMLLSHAKKFNKDFRYLTMSVKKLNEYYIYTRYPIFDHKEIFGHEIFNNKEDAIESLISAKKVFEFVLEKLEERFASKIRKFYQDGVDLKRI